jgi:sigma-B regulation protein RsbU (phosphoserine phosphatase)
VDPSDVSVHLGEDPQVLYEDAPCGQLSMLPDGTIIKVNERLLQWLGHTREDVVGVRRFTDLLTPGARLYHETHMSPLLHMQGQINGIALDLRTAAGARMPVLVSSQVRPGADGRPAAIRAVLLDARDRRAYEQELLWARRIADGERERLQNLVSGLQRSLLPASLPAPPALEIAARYHMASPDVVGGDFYDFFGLPDGRWGFFLGDVCGKGVDAAATTSAARYTLRAAAVYDPDPAAALANLNAVLYQEYYSDRHRHCAGHRGERGRGPGRPGGVAAGRSGRRRGLHGHARHSPVRLSRCCACRPRCR